MNKLRWVDFTNTTAQSFKIYRSLPGIEFQFSLVSTINPTFVFAATSPDVQTITLNTSSIDAFVASLNMGKGITARKTTNGQNVQVRLTAMSEQARLKIFACPLAEDISIPPNTVIVPGGAFTHIGTVSFSSVVDLYEYNDFDGTYLDWYYFTSVDNGKESLPSPIQKPMLPGVAYCMAEARFIDVQGRPVRGVEVIAEPALLDCNSFSTNKVRVVSDAYGRVAIPLIRNQDYVLHIPAIGYNQFITAPEESFCDITQLAATTKPELTP